MFLARHIVRAGDQGRTWNLSREDEEEYLDVINRVAGNLSAKRSSMAPRVDKDFKFHMDCILDVVSHEPRSTRTFWIVPSDDFRQEGFLESYGKTTTRISCSNLTDYLCM